MIKSTFFVCVSPENTRLLSSQLELLITKNMN